MWSVDLGSRARLANKKENTEQSIDTVRASRGGHTFHERWAARRALQLVFPKDGLTAIAVEGLSTSELAKPGKEAEEVADLVLYYGGEHFSSSTVVETAQFKHKTTDGSVSASYLRKTIEKFASSIIGYEAAFGSAAVDVRLSFSFITNAQFSAELWDSIAALKAGTKPAGAEAQRQHKYLLELCKKKGVEARRLFDRTDFRAAEADLPALNNKLRRTVADWSAGADSRARSRLLELIELIREKAGPRGQSNNLIKREDVLDALNCEPEDLFPAETRFVNVGDVVPRAQLNDVATLVVSSKLPLFIHAEAGVGKTVFVESLAATMLDRYEVVVFDCFGGGAYRSPDQARHRPDVGLVQIANELASRGLCDPLLPGDADTVALAAAARRRFSQAVSAIKAQSKKYGLLIVIDAADNAQLEADSRKDDAFPSLILASLDNEPIEGVKLVLTARTYRMGDVIKRAQVLPVPLQPFGVDEARAFLSSRRASVSDVEFSIALSRTAGNGRVLAYLVDTWEVNVVAAASRTEITVEELIAQKCEKIFDDLHVAGWSNDEIRKFFAAISLLPPPIPLEELASALGWDVSQARSAAYDLAPMLELVPQGAIFRDEPTETYVRDTYSIEQAAQLAIAQRLLKAQGASSYAAEALPSFLIAVNDASLAYALANSSVYPSNIQSDFGRRRLQLARLNAALKIAVRSNDIDQVLKLVMRLAQVAAANSRGDEYIRRSPGLAVSLGDSDAYRRLFMDRSGWRGARDARLAVAHAFSDAANEAEIHCNRVIGWINWHVRQPRDEQDPHARRSGPEAQDYAAVLFLEILKGNYESIDRNLAKWNRRFALSVCGEALKLCREFECVSDKSVIDALAAFAGTTKSKSFVLKISLLKSSSLSSQRRKALAESLRQLPRDTEDEDRRAYGSETENDADIIYAAFAALLHDGGTSAIKILRSTKAIRASSYDYGARHGLTKVWLPVLRACVLAWASLRKVDFLDFLPREVKVTPKVRGISSPDELREYLASLRSPRRKGHIARPLKRTRELLFRGHECRDIVRAIEAVIAVVRLVEVEVLNRTVIDKNIFKKVVSGWERQLPTTDYGHTEEAHVVICRTVGSGFMRLLLMHSPSVLLPADMEKLVEIISGKRFSLHERSQFLALIAAKPGLESFAGTFARQISDGIRKDDYIEQRGQDYASLAEGLLEMSVSEARKYFRDGLADLDKLGSNDYEIMYSLLEYAAEQRGGAVDATLAHRMMNLTQTIFRDDPGKFGWTLFGRACAKSVGIAAVTKLVRWDDQDVVDFSYGLPQLACFLAAEGLLAPSRAAALLLISKDHGWHDWSIGDGLRDLLRVTPTDDQRRVILEVVIAKLRYEHSDGGWPSVWKGLLSVVAEFPELLSDSKKAALNELLADTQREQDESDARSLSRTSSGDNLFVVHGPDVNLSDTINAALSRIDPAVPVDLDHVVAELEKDKSLPYHARHQFFERLRESCPYNKRLGHLKALSEASCIKFDEVIDLLGEAIESWKGSSAHIIDQVKPIVEHLFEQRGSKLFTLRYSSMVRLLKRVAGICGDRGFVAKQVLRTIVAEKLELDGNEWLQLGTFLTAEASPQASREALEGFLSGPAAGLADEIGEGPHKPAFLLCEQSLISGVYFHLLGDDDAYMRWSVARALNGVAELGLQNDLDALLDRFDEKEVLALESPERKLPFENSQQWLLMAFARAALYSKESMEPLRGRLLQLAARSDIHVLNKRHMLRCLLNLGIKDCEIVSLRREVTVDPNSVFVANNWPKNVAPKFDFRFDYEFMKSEVSMLARLFWISDGESADAVAREIQRKWPDATSKQYFPGRDRYRRDRSDRYEFFRESVQKHALLSAATTLRRSLSVARQSYDQSIVSPFNDFLSAYDVTFADGSWLADHKDIAPSCAMARFLGARKDGHETLIDQREALDALGLKENTPEIPLYGTWRSPDNVHLRIVTGLGSSRGIVRRCDAFAKCKDHDIWIPMFWRDGQDDKHRQESPFEPLIWAQESCGLGIDAGEQQATKGAARRPRLGIDLTVKLGLKPDADSREWKNASGETALRSQVWGEWKPNPEDHRSHYNEDGEILWGKAAWLDRVLESLGKQLVYVISIIKYKDRSSYGDFKGAKAVYVVLRSGSSGLRVWHAKRASAEMYS